MNKIVNVGSIWFHTEDEDVPENIKNISDSNKIICESVGWNYKFETKTCEKEVDRVLISEDWRINKAISDPWFYFLCSDMKLKTIPDFSKSGMPFFVRHQLPEDDNFCHASFYVNGRSDVFFKLLQDKHVLGYSGVRNWPGKIIRETDRAYTISPNHYTH